MASGVHNMIMISQVNSGIGFHEHANVILINIVNNWYPFQKQSQKNNGKVSLQEVNLLQNRPEVTMFQNTNLRTRRKTKSTQNFF